MDLEIAFCFILFCSSLLHSTDAIPFLQGFMVLWKSFLPIEDNMSLSMVGFKNFSNLLSSTI